jgi:hypothetical protein
MAVLLPGVLGLVRTSNRVIVPVGDTIEDDLYVVGGSVTIEGTVEGDLVVVVGQMTITGEVGGDVVGVVGRRVRIGGSVDGSIRIATPDLDITGRVGDDVAALAVGADLDAVVGRDLLVVAGGSTVGGTIGRDLRGQVWDLDVAADVGNDVLVRVDRLRLEEGARVGGDVLYRASADADVAPTVSVDGELIRRKVLSPVWAKAAERAVAVLGLAGFIVAGLLLFWVFRATAARAVDLPQERPVAVGVTGLAVLVLPPLAVVPLSLTLVGLPVALLVLVLWLLGLFLGAVPTVAWIGRRLLGGRGGLPGGFVLGALVWRGAMWLLPLAAVLLYLTAVLIGLGAFAVAGWERRRAELPEWRPLPPPAAPEGV